MLIIDPKHVPVAVVLDPEYGEALRRLVPLMPVWVIQSSRNRAETDAIWGAKPKLPGSDRLTLLSADPDANSREQSLSDILSDVDLHHGPYSQAPPYNSVFVVGAREEEIPREALATCLLTEVTILDEGVLVTTADGQAAGSEHARTAG